MGAHNEEQYISESIESVLRQNFNDYEFLIIDDGSTDNTPSIIEHYSECDDRIKIITNSSNKGLMVSLNKGIAEARGEYIARMDADDRSLPERFAKQVQFLDANPHTHLVGCSVRYIGPHGDPLGVWSCSPSTNGPEGLMENGKDMAHASVLMRKSSIRAVNGYREPFALAEDLDLWVRLARKFGPKFSSVLPDILFEYRITPDLYRRRNIGEIYGSHVGELVGEEEKLQARISAHLEQATTELSPARYTSMYHITAGRLLRNYGNNTKAAKHFLTALRYDPAFFTKTGFQLLLDR
ncbi:hypothetical protein GCM10008985_09710 [Halococcus dombrowskii]